MINARKHGSYQNSTPTCKYCSTTGHTLANCPTMKQDYKACQDKPIEMRTYKENFAVQYIDRKNSKKKLTKATGGKKCGYCREIGHSRRACPQMEKDKALIIKGNKVWRRLWADRAKQYGLTPASLIKVEDKRYDYAQGGYTHTEFLCTVGSELPENLNVFALGEESKKQEVALPLLGYKPNYGDHNIKAMRLIKCFNESLSRHLFSYSYDYSNIETVTTIAPSSYEFPQGWFDESPTEDIDYALKKWTQEQMKGFLTKVENLIKNYGADYGIS